MIFKLPEYRKPDLQKISCDAKTVPAPADGTAPEGFHSTSMYPEYFRINGKWLLAEDSRMDCCAVVENDRIVIKEMRNLKEGDEVVTGRTENGEEGIFVHTDGFEAAGSLSEAFVFRQSKSRETAVSMEYDRLRGLLEYEHENGNILWVMGPACAFDESARASMCRLIREGYVHGIMAGNALAAHDLEAAYFHTALGQDIYTRESVPSGHHNHLDIINRVRACGSIEAFIDAYHIDNGIIFEAYRKKIPVVLTGSIRDDGPLPEVITDSCEAQDRMRALVRKATTMICMATQLHTIASGNMAPSYRVVSGTVRPFYMYCVDMSEFVTNKLRDRGSLSASTINANVQDFLFRITK